MLTRYHKLCTALGDFLFESPLLNRLPKKLGWVLSVGLLGLRLWFGRIFWRSGWFRLNDWGNQPDYFTQIHPVPYLPPYSAAVITTGSELLLSVLCMLGLAGRPAAFGLLIMSATIQWVIAATPQGIENGLADPEHYLWMIAFLVLTVTGAGWLSADRWLWRWIRRRYQPKPV